MEPVTLLKLVHVVAAIVAVGANLTYGPWLRLAGRDRDRLVFTLRGIRWLDRRVANPAYVLVLVTGVAMVVAGPYRFEHGWIAVSLGLYVVVAVLGITLFGPAVRRQLAAAEADPSSAAYAAAAARSTVLGVIVTAIALVIVALMVTRPF